MLGAVVEQMFVFWMLLQQSIQGLAKRDVDVFRRLVGGKVGTVGIKVVMTPL